MFFNLFKNNFCTHKNFLRMSQMFLTHVQRKRYTERKLLLILSHRAIPMYCVAHLERFDVSEIIASPL